MQTNAVNSRSFVFNLKPPPHVLAVFTHFGLYSDLRQHTCLPRHRLPRAFPYQPRWAKGPAGCDRRARCPRWVTYVCLASGLIHYFYNVWCPRVRVVRR